MRRFLALLAIGSVAGCAYYNAMWSAERYAKDARRFEARGQEPEARSSWARAAAKAESVIVHHPRSRWADDALVLQGEGLARAGTCAAAAAPILKARTTVTDPALRERAGLAAAQCAVAANRPLEAETALADARQSADRARRSRAELLAGQAAMLRLDYEAAAEHLGRSNEPAARPARVRALLAAGRAADAAAAIDSLADMRLRESERAELFAQLAAVGGVQLATGAVDRQLERSRLPFAERARLLTDDGDRLMAVAERDAAEARYRRVLTIVPVSMPEASIAALRLQRVALSRAQSRADLAPIAAALTELTRSDAASITGAQRLLDLVGAASATPPSLGARIRAAELARDSLGAPLLAGALFLDAAAADSASLYAPKALLAALPLVPDRRDSIVAVLEGRYRTSPYTRAYLGEPSVAYAAAEDSLARELGIETGPTTLAVIDGPRVDAPRPGPRGPQLEDGEGPVAGPRAPRAPRPATERPARERPSRPTERPRR